jgi:dolichol-phosphate mannosyltransferase
MKLSIIIACLNEKPTIAEVIKEAKASPIDKEIIVIDNYSTDGTREILEGFKEDKELKIILHSRNMGIGYSGREGLQLAQGKYFYGIGADKEYRLADAIKMVDKAEAEGLDAVFGSRLLDRKNVSKLELVRERHFWLGSIISTALVNFLYQRKFTDIIGSKIIKADVMRSLELKSDTHTVDFESVSKLCKRRYKIGEVPVWYKPRTHKEGKTIRALDIIPALWAIIKVKFFN